MQFLKETADQRNNLIESQRLQQELDKVEIDLVKKKIDFYETRALQRKKEGKSYENLIKRAEQLKKAYAELIEAREESNKVQQAAAGFANDLAGAFGIVAAESTFLGKGLKALSKDGLPELNEQLKESFKGANMAAGAFQKLFEATAASGLSIFSDFQGSITSFNKQTGMLDGTMRRNIESAADDILRYGVTFQDTSDALVSFTNANLMSNKSVRDAAPRLAATTALMTKFGVSAESTAANMEIMIRALNMGADDAIRAQEKIARLGIQIGIGAQAATTSFQQALPRLSLYGTDAVGIFENTARAASKMGMTVDQVLDIGERFQTFQGAAEAAGSLNAILGGGFIDNMELMEASFEDPAKAALLLRDRIKDSGVTLKELGTMGIKAVGEQLGITDPAQVRKFLQGDLSGEDLMKAANDPVVTSLENLADNSQTLAEKQMSMMKDQLSALIPLESMDSSLRGILDSVGGFGLIFAHVGSQIIGAIMMRGAISSATNAGGSLLSGMLPALSGAGAGLMSAALPIAAIAGIGLGGFAAYEAFFKDKRTQPARNQSNQVTSAANKVKQQTQSALTSTSKMAAQTDSILRETNSTLADVRSLLSDIKTNTASTGKQVSNALKAG
ncbi:MAG: hypothetical protein CMD83_18210 [Gammaproteobacteria bacterium]|nr:hypothetical protein [Gammaproteobacteria bacterium]